MSRYIPVDKIRPNPQQPRRVFDEQKLLGLSKTIKRHGVIQPIVVYPDGEFFVLIDGERRWLAAKMAGSKRIRAVICRKPVEGKSQNTADVLRLEKALIANIQRDDMGPVEEGDAYIALMETYHLTQSEIARRLGVNPVRINNCIAIARADVEIRELINTGQLYRNTDLVRALMKIPNRDVRIQMARELATRKLSLQASIKAANVAAKACAAPRADNRSSMPALVFASSKSKLNGKPPQWDVLRQIGRVPEWDAVVRAADQTCRKCSLADIASSDNCGQCPAVDFLSSLMKEAR